MSRQFSVELYDQNGKRITASGGVVKVITAGAYDEVATLDANGAALANPISLSNGSAEFFTADTVETVDIYGQAPDGRGFVALGVEAGVNKRLVVDTSQYSGVLKIPFDIGEDSDITAAAEFDTGFDASANLVFLPQPSVFIGEADATETIDVGTDGAGSDDPNGFLAALAVSGTVNTADVGTLANGAETLGALLFVQDSANAGDDAPQSFPGDGDSITLTLSAGSDTAAGIINLPYNYAGR